MKSDASSITIYDMYLQLNQEVESIDVKRNRKKNDKY